MPYTFTAVVVYIDNVIVYSRCADSALNAVLIDSDRFAVSELSAGLSTVDLSTSYTSYLIHAYKQENIAILAIVSTDSPIAASAITSTLFTLYSEITAHLSDGIPFANLQHQLRAVLDQVINTAQSNFEREARFAAEVREQLLDEEFGGFADQSESKYEEREPVVEEADVADLKQSVALDVASDDFEAESDVDGGVLEMDEDMDVPAMAPPPPPMMFSPPASAAPSAPPQPSAQPSFAPPPPMFSPAPAPPPPSGRPVQVQAPSSSVSASASRPSSIPSLAIQSSFSLSAAAAPAPAPQPKPSFQAQPSAAAEAAQWDSMSSVLESTAPARSGKISRAADEAPSRRRVEKERAAAPSKRKQRKEESSIDLMDDNLAQPRDKVMLVQQELEEVKEVVQVNIDKLLDRGEALSEIELRSTELEASSVEFRKA